MKIICPECKNDVDISSASVQTSGDSMVEQVESVDGGQHRSTREIKKDDILDCNHCGITLQVTDINKETGDVTTEITDEGK